MDLDLIIVNGKSILQGVRKLRSRGCRDRLYPVGTDRPGTRASASTTAPRASRSTLSGPWKYARDRCLRRNGPIAQPSPAALVHQIQNMVPTKIFRSKRFGQNVSVKTLAPKPLKISIHPKPQNLNLEPLNPKPQNPQPYTLIPKPLTRNPQPETLNPKP